MDNPEEVIEKVKEILNYTYHSDGYRVSDREMLKKIYNIINGNENPYNIITGPENG